MDTLGFTTQNKVRKCSQCKGDTEFHCNTCEHELCLHCKERHVIDLYTIDHDVVIYREKYKYIPIQETCEKHPDRIYENFCRSCELPVCFQCTEHRKHQILDIRKAYEEKRQQHREIIDNIRSETIYNSYFLLEDIKSDMKTCRTEIANLQSKTSSKAQKLKNFVDFVVYDLKISYACFLTHRLQQQKRKTNKYLASLENYAHGFKHETQRRVEFLLSLRKTCVPNIKDTLNLTQHALISFPEKINSEDVIKILREINITEKGKRQVRNECLLKPVLKDTSNLLQHALLSFSEKNSLEDVIKLLREINIKELGKRHVRIEPMLHRSFTLAGVRDVIHISCVTSEKVWISDSYNNLILTNTAGDILHQTRVHDSFGAHTVNNTGDLIYIASYGIIKKLSKDTMKMSTLIVETKPWMPHCVYSSPFNGDLLAGMYNTDKNTGTVYRYKITGSYIREIQYGHTHRKLYRYPVYITENRNGDVIVSDWYHDAVVVTDCGGRHRFSYKRSPSGSRLSPCGICTDAQLHILVCDDSKGTVHMINKDGQFLALILAKHHPHCLSYSTKTHLLWVGSLNINRLCVYRYLERHDCMIEEVGARGMVDGGDGDVVLRKFEKTEADNPSCWLADLDDQTLDY